MTLCKVCTELQLPAYNSVAVSPPSATKSSRTNDELPLGCNDAKQTAHCEDVVCKGRRASVVGACWQIASGCGMFEDPPSPPMLLEVQVSQQWPTVGTFERPCNITRNMLSNATAHTH